MGKPLSLLIVTIKSMGMLISEETGTYNQGASPGLQATVMVVGTKM